MDNNYKPLMIPAEILDEMGINNDTPLQFAYDEDRQTLYVTVLTDEDLDSLAGYSETSCDTCRNVEACPDAHKMVHPCDAYIDWRDTW